MDFSCISNLNFGNVVGFLVPVSVFVLVFITKRIILSLAVGILVGALIFNFQSPWNIPFYIVQKITSVFYYTNQGVIQTNWYAIYIFIFLLILGILPQIFIYSGGIDSFVAWARKKVKDARSSEFLIFFAGIIIFIDDQFNALTLGRSVRPLSDASGISRERLAYIIDSTSAPVCILIPLSSWGAYIVGILEDSLQKREGYSPILELTSSIGLNFYAWFALLAVFLTILWRINLPIMHKNINRHCHNQEKREIKENGKISSLLLPIASLAFGTLAMIGLTGYLQTKSSDIFTILSNTNTAFSVFFGGILALFVAILTSYTQIKRDDWKTIITQGLKISFPSVVILILAWAIGTIIRDDLQVGESLSTFFQGTSTIGDFIPVFLFLLSVVIAFATGTSWGCFAVMIPVGVELAFASQTNLSIVLASILSGAIYGDHTSPISDTTILSSAGTGCSVQSHFITQLPYATASALATLISFLVYGFSHSVFLSFALGLGVMFGIFYLWKTRYNQELLIP